MRKTTGIALCALFLATPLLAQIDLSGDWAPLYHEDGPERLPGPELGDYLGLPLNDAGRLRANSYDGDRISVVQEYQCRPHSSDYGLRGLGNLRVWRQTEDSTQRTIAGGMKLCVALFVKRVRCLGGVTRIWIAF